ncbi:MAG: DUF2177 family protein [Proteobacteria bacterium]|nr:DUF2177 family protein [Pseudomonadota bacterium]
MSPATRYTLAAIVGIAAFLALDATWLTLTASRIYRPAIGHLMRDGFDFVPAALFYLAYFVGVAVLVLMPSTTIAGAAWRGALLGFVAYGAYDFTNQATLRDWPWSLTAIDLAWGTFITAACSALTFRVWTATAG